MPGWMITVRRVSAALALALVAVSCASGSAARGVGSPDSVITAREIEHSGASTAYEAVQKLRGNFLRSRGPTSISGTSSPVPNVYVDGTFYGELATLRNIAAGEVAFIRLYPAWEAQTKFGTGNIGGVLEVTTKRQ